MPFLERVRAGAWSVPCPAVARHHEHRGYFGAVLLGRWLRSHSRFRLVAPDNHSASPSPRRACPVYSPGVAQESATIFNDATVNIGFVFVPPSVRVAALASHECACEPVTATM